MTVSRRPARAPRIPDDPQGGRDVPHHIAGLDGAGAKRAARQLVELSAGVTHYDLQGDPDAPTVVLIHGNAAPYLTWDRTVGPLGDAGFRVLRYDLFGHGFSDRPRLPKYDRSFYNAQLSELLSRLGVTDPVRLIGTSQGGSIAACFAAAHPGPSPSSPCWRPSLRRASGSSSLAYRLVRIPDLRGSAVRVDE